MKKLLFILLLLPFLAYPQASKRYKTIIIDNVKALNGGIIDVQDTLKQDIGIKFNDGTFQNTAATGAGDSSFITLQFDTAKAFKNTNLQFTDSAFFQRHLETDLSFQVNDGQTLLKGLDASSANFGLKVQDNVGTDLLNVRNDGRVGILVSNPTVLLEMKGINSVDGTKSLILRNSGNTEIVNFTNAGSINCTNFSVTLAGSGSIIATNAGGIELEVKTTIGGNTATMQLDGFNGTNSFPELKYKINGVSKWNLLTVGANPDFFIDDNVKNLLAIQRTTGRIRLGGDVGGAIFKSIGLQVFGGIAGKRTASGAANVSSADELIIGVDNTASPRTVTLQSVDVIEGKIVIVKDESGVAGTNNITIATQAAETIDGAATQVINTNFGVFRLYSDGVNWFIF